MLCEVTPIMMPVLSDTPDCNEITNCSQSKNIFMQESKQLALPDLLFMIGYATGFLFGSPMADIFGRKKVACWSMGSMMVVTYLQLASKSRGRTFLCFECNQAFSLVLYCDSWPRLLSLSVCYDLPKDHAPQSMSIQFTVFWLKVSPRVGDPCLPQ